MKSELKNGFHSEDLVEFNESDLVNAKWEHAKEFFLGNEKFDVVKKRKSKNGTIYYCINDKKEIALMKSLDTKQKINSLLEEVNKKFNTEWSGFRALAVFRNFQFKTFARFREKQYDFIYKTTLIQPPDYTV